jgi:hypothetical protein
MWYASMLVSAMASDDGSALGIDLQNVASLADFIGDQRQLLPCLRFRVKPGRGDEFVGLFNKFDYGDNNSFHRSRAQVKDGVLCRDAADSDHFYLIGEWADIEEHRRIREFVPREIKPEFAV